MSPVISVIVPAYKVPDRISGIIKDLVAQPFKMFEIIIVLRHDDPETEEKARELAETDARIKVIFQKNNGVSAARNAGIDAAEGQFLVFADADDRVTRGYLGTLLGSVADSRKAAMSKGFPRISAQMAMTGYDVVEDDRVIDGTTESGVRVMDTEDFLCRLFFQENYQGYVWNKIFRKSIIDKFHLRFNEDIYYREDQLFVCEYALHSEAIRFNPARVYHYVRREDSATGQLDPEDGVLKLDVLEREMTQCLAFSRMRKLLEKHEDPQWYLEQEYVFYALEVFYRMRLVDDRTFFKDSYFRKIAKEVLSIDYYPLDDWEKEQLESMQKYAKTGKTEENPIESQ